MAIIVDQYWIKDGLDTDMDESGLITHRESTIIRYDEVVLDGPDAMASSGFEIGQVHRNNANLFLNGNIQASPMDEDTGAVWRYDLTYTTNGFNLTISGEGSNRVEVRTGSWTYNAVVEVDKETKKAILNPAGDPYDPMPEEPIFCPVLIITKRENSAKINMLENVGSINRSKIKIAGVTFPKYCAQFSDYSSTPVFDDEGFTTFLNTYTIRGLFKKNVSGDVIGFKQELLARGFNKKKNGKSEGITVQVQTDPNETDPSKIKYTPVPVSEPQMLTEEGELGGPFYQEFVVHDLFSFSSLRLPSSYPVN
tara:strand:+ start:896 stop:1822 length:927 start_codon:yes stop_codon:yes gene_type:complete